MVYETGNILAQGPSDLSSLICLHGFQSPKILQTVNIISWTVLRKGFMLLMLSIFFFIFV